MAKIQGKSLAKNIAYIAMMVALITVCAYISLPIGEVPFTLQTFAVCLAGALLGWKRGTIAVAVYILMGIVGIPVFAGFKNAEMALVGATGGYIIGFLFTAPIVGFFKLVPVKNKWWRALILFVGMIVGLAVCYFFGTAWFIMMYLQKGSEMTIAKALALCVIPYIVPDLVKLALCALLVSRIERFVK